MTDALRAIYDLRYSPCTFDFAVFLALTDCVRQAAEKKSIDLTINASGWRNQTKRDRDMPKAEKQWRLKSIILAACDLLPTLRDVAVERSGRDREYDFPANIPEFYDPSYRPPYLASHVLDLYRMGADPRVLKAPAYAKAMMDGMPKAYVTLTLRQSKHFPERNVDMAEWARFCCHLKDKGYSVITVPDTEHVLDAEKWSVRQAWDLPSGIMHIPAALDQRLRMALYEGAAMNVCSSNGPAAMMFYSRAPVLQFDQMRGGVFNAEKWTVGNGFPPGEQFPWSAPNQRMVWQNSDYETLVSEFEKVMS